jgi:tetratricopeptide (TPR) repeat protein
MCSGKPKMKVLVLGFGNAKGRFNPPSTHCENYITRHMGEYEIITFGYNDGVDIIVNPEDDFKKVLESLPSGWIPDICLLWMIEWNLLPRGIEDAPFPTVACMFDWDYDIPYSRTCIESVDLTIVTGDRDKEAVKALGANNVESFYFAGIMREFIDSHPKKMKDRRLDILYTTWIDDSVQPGRSGWIYRLCSLSERYNIHIDKSLSYVEYISLLRESKLVLSYNRHGSMTVRTTDAGGQGTVVLETGSGAERYFSPNIDYIHITEKNFTEQIEWFLNDENALQEMSDKFYEKVTKEFEARKRFIEMLKFAELCLQNKKLERRFNSYPKHEKCIRRGENYYHAYLGGSSGTFFTNPGSKFLELSAEEFRNALAIKPTPRVLVNLALVKTTFDLIFHRNELLKNKAKEIIPFLEQAISAYPSYAMSYFHLGIVHLRVGNRREALQALIDALRLFKDKDSYVDPWCLQNRDYDVFNLLMRSTLNENLSLLCSRQEKGAMDNIRNLYQSITLYVISTIEDQQRNIYKGLQACLGSYQLYPASGLIAWKVAIRLAMLGFKEESLMMYKKAINSLPLNIDLRIEFIKLLYLYQKDKEMVEEIKDAFTLTKTFVALKERAYELRTLLASFQRFGPDTSYSQYDARELLLNSWVEALFICLKANPNDINLMKRIIDIWNELGRTDKILEILEDYINNHFKESETNGSIQRYFTDIYNNLNKKLDRDNTAFSEKFRTLSTFVHQLSSHSKGDSRCECFC